MDSKDLLQYALWCASLRSSAHFPGRDCFVIGLTFVVTFNRLEEALLNSGASCQRFDSTGMLSCMLSMQKNLLLGDGLHMLTLDWMRRASGLWRHSMFLIAEQELLRMP